MRKKKTLPGYKCHGCRSEIPKQSMSRTIVDKMDGGKQEILVCPHCWSVRCEEIRIVERDILGKIIYEEVN